MKSHSHLPKRGRQGFTLVELVTLLAVATLLLAIGMPAFARNRQKALQIGCASNLKRLGEALRMYTDMHEGALPGPVLPVPQAGYDTNSRQELAWFLAGILGHREPSTNVALASELLCPASPSGEPDVASLAKTKSYVLADHAGTDRGGRTPLFGRVGETESKPVRLSELDGCSVPFRTPVMTDADKANVDPILPSWKELPYRPAHGRTRTRLMLDWHVEVKAW